MTFQGLSCLCLPPRFRRLGLDTDHHPNLHYVHGHGESSTTAASPQPSLSLFFMFKASTVHFLENLR